MRALLTYFGFAFLISWGIWFPLYGFIFGISGLPVLPFHHAIGGLGPLLAAMITTWRYEGRQGLMRLLRQLFRLRPFVYVVIALLSPFVLAWLSLLLDYAINHKPIDLRPLLHIGEFPEFNFFSFFIYNLIFFGFGEETGWRGFALPRLQAKFNALTACVILTFFWAIWHWPLFFYRPGFMTIGIGGGFGWLFSLLTGSVLLTWLYNASRGSIVVCALFHCTIDVVFLADFADAAISNYMGMLITLWGICTILIFKPKNLAASARIVK